MLSLCFWQWKSTFRTLYRMNPLLQKRALDALLEVINDPDYATQQHHSDPDYTTQNGKLYGKGTETEQGALRAGPKLGALWKEKERDYRARALKPPSGMTPTGDTPTHTDDYETCIGCGEVFNVDPRLRSDMCSECRRKEKFSQEVVDPVTEENLVDEPPTVEKGTFYKESEPGADFEQRFKELADDPSSKYERACYLIADDEELWNMVVDYVSVPDAPIEKLAPILKTIPPFVPSQWSTKCVYRGEPHYSGEYNEDYHYRGKATWTGSHREVLSWSSNWDTAKYFAEGQGFVWQTVGKIKGVALSDICTARNRMRPKESNYCGMQAEWFVLSSPLQAVQATPTDEQRKQYRYGSEDLILDKTGAIRPSPSDVFKDKIDQSSGIQRYKDEENVDRPNAPDDETITAADDGEEEHGNVPDTGDYDFEHEAHVREEAKDWAQYAEESDNTGDIKPFDPSGNYLCGTCDMRRGTNECARVDGEINFAAGSCRLYHLGDPETDPPMKNKFTKEDVDYTERPNVKGFGCKRCEYGSEAQGEDPEGRKSWCSFWGMHVVPNACCAENEGEDDTTFTEAGGNIDVPIEALKGEPEKSAAREFEENLMAALGQKVAAKKLYHVTHSDRVPRIKSEGILPAQTSNWVDAATKQRYGGGEVFAFTHPEDAVRWAAKMDWEFNKEMGSGKISVVTFDGGKRDWKIDEADPLSHAGHKGDWVKTVGKIDAKDIKKVTQITGDLVRAVVKGDPIKLGSVYKSYGTGTPLGGAMNAIDEQEAEEDDAKTSAVDECHHERLVCKKCGNVQTCRCSEPKVTKEIAACSNCTPGVLARAAARTAAAPPTPTDVEIKETPRFLPPRDDVRRHIDKGETDALMVGVSPEKDGIAPTTPARPKQIDPRINPDGKVADLGDEMRQDEYDEHFLDQVYAVKSEAKSSFMEDPYMQQQAVDAEMNMEELWKELGEDYTNDWYESTHARMGSKSATKKCPKCKNAKGKIVKDGAESAGNLMECLTCGSFF